MSLSLTLIDENYEGESHEILDKCFKNPFYPWFARRKKDKFSTVFQNISFINQFMNCFITGRGKMYFPLVFEVIRRTCFALTSATPFIVPSTLLLVGF